MAHRPERELKPPRPRALHIRAARAEDHGTLQDILRLASLANPGDVDWLLAHPEVMVVDREQLRGGRIHIAEHEDGQAAGYAAVLPPQGGQAEIDGIFVRPAHWRQGVGRALLLACAQQARAEGASELRVVVNPHALGFYAALGFELCDDGAAPAVMAGLAHLMRRAIDGAPPPARCATLAG